jgi:hypothetical protein
MKHVILLPALLLSLAAGAAEPTAKAPKTNLIDHSNNTLISADAAKGVMARSHPGQGVEAATRPTSTPSSARSKGA